MTFYVSIGFARIMFTVCVFVGLLIPYIGYKCSPEDEMIYTNWLIMMMLFYIAIKQDVYGYNV